MKSKTYINILLLLTSFTLMLVVGELLVRIVPPKGGYSSGAIDDSVIGYRHKPGSWRLYNKQEEPVKSVVNRYGFLDIDHDETKADSIERVAFFGDSYVEALQVPLEDRFFRILPESISGTDFEYLAFGMSGLGTIHSYLNSQKWADIFDIDLVVYVFVENDLGDNISWIKKNPARPYASKVDFEPGFVIDRDFTTQKKSFLHNLMAGLKNRSILVQVILQRVRLLLEQGVQTRLDEKEQGMKTESKKRVPNQNDLPSTWDKSVKSNAQELAYSILKQWSKEVRNKGKKFAILYVPRGNDFLTAESQKNETWKRWLLETTKTLKIPLIDPSKGLLAKQKTGVPVYSDHFSKAGHEVVSQVISNWLRESLPNRE